MKKYQVGNRVTGVINNVTKLGIFVTLPGDRFGLIHHSDFAGDWPRMKRRYKKGDQVRVVVVHSYKGRLALSLRRVNDPNLIDHANQFSQTKAADFAAVLKQTMQDAKSEIKNLQQVLIAEK